MSEKFNESMINKEGLKYFSLFTKLRYNLIQFCDVCIRIQFVTRKN